MPTRVSLRLDGVENPGLLCSEGEPQDLGGGGGCSENGHPSPRANSVCLYPKPMGGYFFEESFSPTFACSKCVMGIISRYAC